MLKYADEVSDNITVEPTSIDKLSANEMMLMVCELPVMQRTVFNMLAIDGFTHREIAEQLNIPEGTSKWYMAEAKRKLQKSIKV